MPLVTINCKPEWRLPDAAGYDVATEADPKLRAVYTIAHTLTQAVASAVNQVDSDEKLTPSQVLVNFGQMHGASLNAAEIQILINPGAGNVNDPIRVQRRRRVAIHDYVHAALVALINDLPGHLYDWPEFDIEIVPTNMSGSNTTPDGVMRAPWGGVEKEPRPFVEPSAIPAEDFDATA